MMPTLALLAAAAATPPWPTSLPLAPATLAALPRISASLTAHGSTQTCEGVALSALAAAAGLPAGKAVSGPALGVVIVAEARDGYRVAFTLGELDALLGNTAVIIADRCDGKPLAETDGPLRLVVPGDTRAARSVRQLARLRVIKAGD